MKRSFTLIAMATAMLWVLLGMRQPRECYPFHAAGFGRLPAVWNGRLQPLDSVARNSLLVLRGRQSVPVDGGKRPTPSEWILELMAKPDAADKRRVFRIDHQDVLALVRLRANGQKDFSFDQIAPALGEFERESERARLTDLKDRGPFERAVVRLDKALVVYDRLKHSLRPESSTNLLDEIVGLERSLPAGLAAWHARQSGRQYNAEDLDRLATMRSQFDGMLGCDHLLPIPPPDTTSSQDDWSSLGSALRLDALRVGRVHEAAMRYGQMVTALRENKPDAFNSALAKYRAWLSTTIPVELRRVEREYFYRHWQPFLKSVVLYGFVFVLGLGSWFGWFQQLNRVAYGVLVVAFLVHTAGIVFRMAIEGRPPVTNLYSSAVFVGWGAVALGILIEHFNRDGIGLVLSAALGLITQIIAHNLAVGGDTMGVLRAVLDSNFWLATHVITVTLGYSACFVAGFLGVVYVLRAFFTRGMAGEVSASLARMVYGTVCFATLFSFVGTVLGGIWADQSWGRFWGWDPKENGALLVVVWNAIVLHARWIGMVRDRGLMNLAIFGNVVTAFSWFGVNMLGVGLHAYGFMERAMFWLVLFVLSQIGIVGLSLIPDRYWASFRDLKPIPERKTRLN